MKDFFKKIILNIIAWEAKEVLKKYNPKVIAITGSVGKTSTKDAIFDVIKSSFKARKSDKSFNSEIGIPLSILGCPNGWNNIIIWIENIIQGLNLIYLENDYPDWLVLEIGADRPGDIQKIATWLKTDIAVFTRFGQVPVHVEFFDSPKQVIEEKSKLVNSLHLGGMMILNADDADVFDLGSKNPFPQISYGIESPCDVSASNISVIYDSESKGKQPMGLSFKINYQGSSAPIVISKALGRSHIYPALAAAAVGLSQGLNLVDIGHALSIHDTPPGRMKIVDGNKDTTIIDDTYNSSPVAAQEAIETLKKLISIRFKIAVLGDMLEIGKYTVSEHTSLGERVVGAADLLVAVGVRARLIAEGALKAGMSEKNIFQFDDSRTAGKFIESILQPGDIILVKGSQGMRMERVVEEIMAHPEKKERYLVRQSEKWKTM